jgi:hypothetical protein
METADIERIQEVVKKESEWATESLVFKLTEDSEDPGFDVIPYLGMGPKSNETLAFLNPKNLTLGELVDTFKVQAIEQGVHLRCIASCKLADSKSGIFFKLACSRHRLYAKKRDKPDNKNGNSNGPPAVPLYEPGVKIGAPRFSKIRTRGREGRKMKRKTETGLPLEASDRCPFFFRFKMNCEGTSWVLTGGSGCPTHSNHFGDSSSGFRRTHELPTMVKQKIADLTDATANSATTRKIMAYQSGLDLTVDQIAYIRSVYGNTNKLDEFGNHLSSADQLLAYLDSRPDVSYIAVADKIQSNLLTVKKGGATKQEQKMEQKILQISRMSKNSNPTYAQTNEPAEESPGKPQEQELCIPIDDPIFLDARETREALRVKNSDQILLAVAWVCDEEKRLFMLFPEVTFWDTAQKTNREKRPIFLAAGKDSRNKTFTYLRAFMPSECTWVFNWLYETAMPALLGASVLKDTNLSLTDGDKNEYGPLESLIAQGTFASSTHGLCGFHLVDRSMVSNPFGKPGEQKLEKFLKVKGFLRAWLYSWMRVLENEDEFQTSKKLLIEWLGSNTVVDCCSASISRNMVEWVIKKILPYMDKCLLYPRLRTRAYSEFSNSVAEFEVSCMKEGSAVMPYMPLADTARGILVKTDLKMKRKTVGALHSLSTTPLWSRSSSSMHVTMHAEGILQQQYLHSTAGLYSYARTESRTWLVRREARQHLKAKTEEVTIGYPIPKFIRTRRVRLIGDNLVCSCGFFERLGLPCRHLFYVLQRGPIPEDCATRWRRDYIALRYTGSKEYDIAFKVAKKRETIGPYYDPGDSPTCYPVFWGGNPPGPSPVDMRYYEEPLNCTLYMIEGSPIQQSTRSRDGKALPAYQLPTHSQLSQLTEEQNDDDYDSDIPTFIENTQAYHLMYPKFKQICLVADGNSRIISLAMQAMRNAYVLVVQQQTEGKTPSDDIKRFTSSNLSLDSQAKSNKRIKPMGERENTNRSKRDYQ